MQKIEQAVQIAKDKNVPVLLSVKAMAESINSMFPRRMSISPEHMHTTDDTKMSMHTFAKPWHITEILQLVETQHEVRFDYIALNNTWVVNSN